MFHLDEGLCGVSRVRPDDQAGVLAALHHALLQLVPPDVFTGVKDVVAVTDYRHRPGGELVQDSLKRLLLSAPPPGDDGTALQEVMNTVSGAGNTHAASSSI